jgi:hypothetical protein
MRRLAIIIIIIIIIISPTFRTPMLAPHPFYCLTGGNLMLLPC